MLVRLTFAGMTGDALARIAGDADTVTIRAAAIAELVNRARVADTGHPLEIVAVPRHALAELVNYCHPSEEADYVREGEPSGHVFEYIRALDAALQAYTR